MKSTIVLASILAMLAVVLPASIVFADETQPLKFPIGFKDSNGDGKNDLFRDADGDGKDDISGRPYPHTFLFRDDDHDGRNDLFRDADGDGVNDLFVPGTHARSRGIIFSLDGDGDGVNDVTGKPIREPGMGRGYMGGQDDFIDEDGDGIDDRRMQGMGRHWRHRYGKNSSRDNDQQKDGKGNDEDQDQGNGKGKGKNNLSAR